MQAMQIAVESLNMSSMVLKTYLDDLSEEEFLLPAGQGCHCAAWQLGHLISSANHMLEGLKPGSGMELPEGFSKAYSKAALESGVTPAYLAKADYFAMFDRVNEAARKLFLSMTEADLDQPGPPGFPPMFSTVGSIVVLIASHPLMHAGQFVPLRRQLGKPIRI